MTKLKKAAALFLAALMLALCLSGCEDDSGSLERILQKKQIVFGIEPESAPMSFITDSELLPEAGARLTSEQLTGLNIDVADELSQRLNVEAVYVIIEPENALTALNDGKIDCYAFLARPDIKTAAQMRTVDTGLDCRRVIIAKDGSDMDSLLDVKGKTVAYVSGSDAQVCFEEATVMHSSCAGFVACSDLSELIAIINSDMADAAVVDEPQFLYRVKGRRKYIAVAEPVAASDYLLAFRLRDGELAERISEIYSDMLEDGTLEAIREEWWGE